MSTRGSFDDVFIALVYSFFLENVYLKKKLPTKNKHTFWGFNAILMVPFSKKVIEKIYFVSIHCLESESAGH